MSPPDHGWAWLEPNAPPAPDGDERSRLARAFARVFSGAEGEWVLAHLKSLTVDRCLGPDATDTMLRSLEGQRQLVHHVMSLIARGRDGR